MKTSGFRSLRLKYWEINQATPKCKIDFWTKLAKGSKIEKVIIKQQNQQRFDYFSEMRSLIGFFILTYKAKHYIGFLA